VRQPFSNFAPVGTVVRDSRLTRKETRRSRRATPAVPGRRAALGGRRVPYTRRRPVIRPRSSASSPMARPARLTTRSGIARVSRTETGAGTRRNRPPVARRRSNWCQSIRDRRSDAPHRRRPLGRPEVPRRRRRDGQVEALESPRAAARGTDLPGGTSNRNSARADGALPGLKKFRSGCRDVSPALPSTPEFDAPKLCEWVFVRVHCGSTDRENLAKPRSF
jgi:hypothetical protein